MGNYEELKAAVASVIKTNGNQEITGQVLQNTLTTLISQVGANATFAGIATPDTAPGTPDQNVFYLAAKPSTYVNFDSLIVNPGEIAIFSITGNSWVKAVVGEFADITTQRIIKDVLPGTITPIYPTWIRGEYYDINGEARNTAMWERAVMNITPYLGQTIYLRLANLGVNYTGYCVFVNTGTGQKQSFLTAQSTNMLNIVVPAWATELRISNRWATEPNPLIQISSVPMLAKQSDIDMIDKLMPRDNISDAWITGEYYDQTGNIGIFETWSRLPEIDVSANVGQILYCYGYLAAGGYVVIKNTAGDIINTYQFIGNYQIVIPAEAATILICNRTASIPNPYFSFSNSIVQVAPLGIVKELQGRVSGIDSILPKGQLFLFIQGSITATGTENSNATRIRTQDFLQLGSPILLFSNVGFGYRVFEYDQNYTYLGWTGFEAGGLNTFTKKYANTKYYKFVVLKTNSATITPAEINDSGFSINGNKNGYQEITPLSNVLQLFPGMPSNVVLTWIRGEYYNVTGAVGEVAIWERAEPLDVSGYTGHYIAFNGELVEGGYGVYTDENDSVISTFQTTNQRYISTIPAGAKWLKISNRWTTVAKASVFIDGAGNIPRLVQLSDISAPKNNNLAGKKVAFIGDSITAAGGYANTFANLYGCMVVNLGVSGTCIANNTSNDLGANRFVTRATAENLAGVDLIVVFGGTNDFSYDIKPIGDLFVVQDRTATGNIGNKTIVAPADTDAFGGALHDLIKTIQTNAPTIPIVFMTPLRRGRYTASNPTSLENNKYGNFMREFAEAIIEICTFYSIPVLDLNAVSNLDFTNINIAAKYSSDALHLNNAGHTLIGNMLFRFVEANLIIL